MSSTNPGPATTTGANNLGGGSPMLIGDSATSLVGFYGATPIVQGSAVTTLATTPTATDIAVAVNSIIAALKNVGITA
jgi:hypothetical protein